MPRKTDGQITSRKKKATSSVETTPVQAAPKPAQQEFREPEIRSNVTPINASTITVSPVKQPIKKATPTADQNLTGNFDSEIRSRAYQLFLERHGAAGDPVADWFVAEREVMAKHAKDSALAARQGH